MKGWRTGWEMARRNIWDGNRMEGRSLGASGPHRWLVLALGLPQVRHSASFDIQSQK